MKERPAGVEERAVAGALRERWGLPVAGLRYAPVGFGDYHWVADGVAGERWFVTVSEPRAGFARLRTAMDTAAALAEDAGLDFVVAPMATAQGDTVLPLGTRHTVAVFPFVDAAPGHFDDAVTADERLAVVRVLAELHRATPKVASAPVFEVAPTGRAVLESALAELDRPWSGGPYSERARHLLAGHGSAAFHRVMRRFDELARRVTGDRVITHGEPHPGNVLRAGDRPLLVDWDTVGLAVPERDLWMVSGGDRGVLDAYTDLTGRAVSEDAPALFRLRWDLDDLTVYLGEFRAPHEETADTRLAWSGFRGAIGRALDHQTVRHRNPAK